MDEDIFCECGLSFKENEFTMHFRQCKILYHKYEDFDFKLSQLLKKYINSIESLIIINFFFKRLIKIFNQELKNYFTQPTINTININIKKIGKDSIKLVEYNHKFNNIIKEKKVSKEENINILEKFTNLYPQNILLDGEKKDIYIYLFEKNNFIKHNFRCIISDLQIIIGYLTNEIKDKNIFLSDIIKNLPNFILLNQEIVDFFDEFSNIKIEKLYEVFIFIELLCYDSEDLKDEYQIDLDKNIEETINTYYNNGTPKIIEKHNLADACRKLISRYLVNNNIDPDNLLFSYLNQKEFWDANLISEEKYLFEKEIDKISTFNIKIKHAFKLSLILDKDNILRKNAIEKFLKNVENNNDINKDNKKIIKRRKKK